MKSKISIQDSLTIREIEKDIRQALERSYQNENTEILYKQLLPFVAKIINGAVKSESFSIYSKYIVILRYLYFIASEKNNNLSNGIKEYVSLRLKEIYLWGLKSHIEDLKNEEAKIEFTKKYVHFILAIFNNHMKDILNKRDLKTYRYSAHVFYAEIFWDIHQDDYEYLDPQERRTEYENIIIRYIDNMAFFQYSWIIVLYQEKRLSAQDANEFLSQHKIQFYFFENFLDSLLYIFKEGYSDYLGVMEWEQDLVEQLSSSSYSPLDPRDWVATGALIFLIKNSGIIKEDIESDRIKSVSSYFGNHWETINNKLTAIETNIKKILPLLENKSEFTLEEEESKIKEYSEAIKIVREKLNNIFVKLQKEEFIREKRKIVDQQISEEKKNEFKKWVGESWSKRAALHRIFDYYKNLEDSVSDKLKWIGDNLNVVGGKMMFITEGHQHIYGASDVGAKVADYEDEIFLTQISKTDIPQYESISECLDKLITEIKSNGFEPNVIFLGYKWNYSNMGLVKDESFKIKGEIENEERDFVNVGYYKDIPCVCSYNKVWEEFILVADFPNAFVLEQERNKEWYQEQLKVEIKTVTDEEAEEIYNTNSNKWSKTSEGIELSKEEAIDYYIKSSINWSVAVHEFFKVKDAKAFSMGKIFKSAGARLQSIP